MNLEAPPARPDEADIERIRPDEINRACERVVSKDVRYRFVIDMASHPRRLGPRDRDQLAGRVELHEALTVDGGMTVL